MWIICTLILILAAIHNSIESGHHPYRRNPRAPAPAPEPLPPRPYVLVIDGMVQNEPAEPPTMTFEDGSLMYRNIRQAAIGIVFDNTIYERSSIRRQQPLKDDTMAYEGMAIAKFKRNQWKPIQPPYPIPFKEN